MSVTSGFFNSLSGDRKYDAIQISSMFDGLITDGIYNGYLESFMVTASSPASMVVTVGEGRCWFNHTWTLNDAPLPLTLDVGDVVLNRIDTVVIDVDSTDTVRACTIKVIKGTPSSQAVAPTLENTETHHQYPLCDISVVAGATTVTQSNITNRRGTSDCPFVATLMTTVTVDELLVQWESQWNDWMTDRTNSMDSWTAEQQEAFTTWFQTVQDILDEDTAGNLLNRINHRTGINATATYSEGVVAITAPDDAGEILTFVAPSDFLSSDTYTLNGAALTITDLNGEALDDSWKKNSPITITVSGGKAFFKAGGSGKNDTLPPLLGNMTVEVVEGEETDTYTIKMDKLVLDKTTEMVGGAQLEWGEEMPVKPGKGTGGIKTWTREEIITTGKPYDGLYLGDVTPSDVANDTILWLPENQSGSIALIPFLVLGERYGGVAIIRENGLSATVYGTSATPYDASTLDDVMQSYENSVLGEEIASQIMEVEIPVGSGTITRTVFALSATEYGYTGDSLPVEGSAFLRFSSDAKRIAYSDQGGVCNHWTRTRPTGTSSNAGYIATTGAVSQTSVTASYYARPAFVLPKDFKIQQRPDGSYTVWNEQGLLTLGDIEASNISTSSIVNVTESGQLSPFILLSQKYNEKDVSVMHRENLLPESWNSNYSGTTDYAASGIQTKFEEYASSTLDTPYRALLVSVEVTYKNLNPSDNWERKLSTKCCAIGAEELGIVSGWGLGNIFSYYVSSENKKKKHDDGSYDQWYTRDIQSAFYSSNRAWDDRKPYFVNASGTTSGSPSIGHDLGLCPMLFFEITSPIRQLADGTYDLVPEDPALSEKQARVPDIPATPPEGTPIQLKDIPVSDASIKRTLILPEGENGQPFIYLSSNYNESGRGMMLREFTLPESTEFSVYGVWNYASSLLFQKIANWFDTLPSDLKRWIDPITIHYRYATGYTSSSTFLSGTVEAPAFPLTYNNVSGSKGDSSYYGENIPYFTSDGRRKAFIEGTETSAKYWLSDAHSKYDAFSSGVRFYTIGSSGTISYGDFRDDPQYIRPAITLSPETWFTDNGDDTYTFLGDEPASSEFVSHTIEIPHGQKVVFRQFTQNQKKQFQTMLVGGVYPPLGDVEPPFALPEFTGNHAIFGDETAGRIELYEAGELTLSPGTYDFFLVGGGSNGNNSLGGSNDGAGGGAGGYTKTIKDVIIEKLTPMIPVLVGAANSKTAITIGDQSYEALPGAVSSARYGSGKDGGSGGGVGMYDNDDNPSAYAPGLGGSDGSDGGSNNQKNFIAGKGQHTTTRAFEEEAGTLYSGGGSGGTASGRGYYAKPATEGGGGAGGNGSSSNRNGGNATPNTGGGGGGAASGGSASAAGGLGASGILIIRWNNVA